MSSPSPAKRRMDTDIIKLIEIGYEVNILGDALNSLQVTFPGPQNTPYEGGKWFVKVELPDQYPFKSPSIGFVNRIFHPNIDEASGTVCLDVINQTWTPIYELTNVFESFLPQLLTYPNPQDPLNDDAAHLFIHNREEYNKKVQFYVRTYAGNHHRSNEIIIINEKQTNSPPLQLSKQNGDVVKNKNEDNDSSASLSDEDDAPLLVL